MVTLCFIWTPRCELVMIASWSQMQTSYSRNCEVQGPAWSPVVMVAVLPPRAGGAGLLVEEEADFGKFPDSHLPLLSGKGRRNEIRQRRMGWHLHHGWVPTPGCVKDQCEFKGFVNLSAPIRGMYTIKFSIFNLSLYKEVSHNLAFKTIIVLRPHPKGGGSH